MVFLSFILGWLFHGSHVEIICMRFCAIFCISEKNVPGYPECQECQKVKDSVGIHGPALECDKPGGPRYPENFITHYTTPGRKT